MDYHRHVLPPYDKHREIADVNCRKSTLKSLSTYVGEHYPNAAYGVYPIENDSKIAIIIVANKYSPNNYW